MEKELNYLSEKIEDLQQDVDFYESESKRNESEIERAELNEIWTRKTTELEYLENILNYITAQYLS